MTPTWIAGISTTAALGAVFAAGVLYSQVNMNSKTIEEYAKTQKEQAAAFTEIAKSITALASSQASQSGQLAQLTADGRSITEKLSEMEIEQIRASEVRSNIIYRLGKLEDAQDRLMSPPKAPDALNPMRSNP